MHLPDVSRFCLLVRFEMMRSTCKMMPSPIKMMRWHPNIHKPE